MDPFTYCSMLQSCSINLFAHLVLSYVPLHLPTYKLNRTAIAFLCHPTNNVFSWSRDGNWLPPLQEHREFDFIEDRECVEPWSTPTCFASACLTDWISFVPCCSSMVLMTQDCRLYDTPCGMQRAKSRLGNSRYSPRSLLRQNRIHCTFRARVAPWLFL